MIIKQLHKFLYKFFTVIRSLKVLNKSVHINIAESFHYNYALILLKNINAHN